MTYRRDLHSWPGAMSRAVALLGRHQIAAALAISESRVEQLSNPMRADWRTADIAVAVDNLLIEAGHGPVFVVEVHRRLRRHGQAIPVATLLPAVRAAVGALRRILDDLAAVLGEPARECAA